MADNSSRKFKFISPGVFIDEIDQSELPAEIGPIGPVIIGRTRQGPGMKPVTVSSFQDFVETFGAPWAFKIIPGSTNHKPECFCEFSRFCGVV